MGGGLVSLAVPPPLPGWLWNGEQLVADDSVEGALHRGLAVVGACRLRPECTRSVRLDLEYLAYHGAARERLPIVRRRYECGRLPKCELNWIESHPAGAPLQAFADDPNTWLVVKCATCGAAQSYTFERMIRALVAAGRGGGNTSVRAVGERLRQPCKDCRGVRWLVEIVREHAPGSGATTLLQRPNERGRRG